MHRFAVTATRFSASSKTSPPRKHAELEADAHRRELAHLSRVAMLERLRNARARAESAPAAVLSNAQAARRMLDRDPLDVEELQETLDDIIRNEVARAQSSIVSRAVAKGETTVGGRCRRSGARSPSSRTPSSCRAVSR